MRVIHLSCVGPPETGGIGEVAAAEVRELVARGVEATHVHLGSHPSVRCGNAGRILAARHLLQEADIVHLHYPFFGMNGLVARLRKRGVITRLVVTLHMEAHAGGMKGWVFAAQRRWVQSRVLAQADALLASTREYCETSSYAPFLDRTTVVPFGVDEQIFTPGPGRPDRFGCPAGVPCVLFVGGMDVPHRFKGVDVLLRALRDVPEMHAILVGEGSLRGAYERLARELGIAERCFFVGRLPRTELVNAFRSADVFVLPSVSRAEAFGLVAVEAQACGRPVIASNLPGVRTVVADEESGFLVEPGNGAALAAALRRLASSPEMREQFGRRGRERVLEAYTWTRHGDALLEIYRRLV